jgi:catechol 2,3-dioxygenase-like lactoylglutathione lyase family enzyme
MNSDVKARPNINQAVPFFAVPSMENSLRFYVDGLGFEMTHKWIHHDKIEWCCLQRGGGSIMLQEFRKEGPDARAFEGKLGEGIAICFICEDALELYHELITRGIKVSEPFVGNGMWVIRLSDPDGYKLEFESNTDVPEETRYSDWKDSQINQL